MTDLEEENLSLKSEIADLTRRLAACEAALRELSPTDTLLDGPAGLRTRGDPARQMRARIRNMYPGYWREKTGGTDGREG